MLIGGRNMVELMAMEAADTENFYGCGLSYRTVFLQL